MKKVYTLVALLIGSVSVHASVLLDFRQGGGVFGTNATTITLSNLSGSVTSTGPVRAPAVDSSKNAFTQTGSTGVINIDFLAVGRPGNGSSFWFVPDVWEGGSSTLSNCVLHSTGESTSENGGWGVYSDFVSNGTVQNGEALILTFDFSGLNLAADQRVVLKMVNFATTSGGEKSADLWQRDYSVAVGTSGAGFALVTNAGAFTASGDGLILNDGDTFAIYRNAYDTRLRLMEIDIITIPEPGTVGLFLIAGVGVVLRRRLIKR